MNIFKEKRNQLMNEMEQLVNTAKTEVRALNDTESARYDELKAEIDKLDKTIAKDAETRELGMRNAQPSADGKDKEESETRAFEQYLRKGQLETRADSNITYGDNGAVIPTTILNKIIKRVEEICPIFQLATKYNVKGNLTIPYVDTSSGDITVAFADEFSELASSSIKFSSIELKGYLAACLVKVSKQMMNNSQFDILSFVIQYMAEKISKFIESFAINGNKAKNPKSGLANSVTQSVTIGTNGKITGDDLIEIQESIIDALQGGCVWVMNRATRTKLHKLKDNDGNYLLNRDLTSKWGYTLLDKPIYTTDEVSSDLTKAGETILYYGDMSALAIKVGEQAEIQVLQEQFATQHCVGLVAWMELDATVENAQKIVKAIVPAKA